jgi:inorganic triphosphatase YgiF
MTKNHPEIEDKYAVGPEDRLPELGTLAEVASVSGPTQQDLETTYFDTAALTLTTVGITVRRRAGGDDAGWHVKLPTSKGRYEVHAPLGRSRTTVPKRLRDLLMASVREQGLAPIAKVSTHRTVRWLTDAGGRVLAEVADDEVTTQALGHDGNVVSFPCSHPRTRA